MHKITMTATTAWIKTERTTDRTGQKLSAAQIEKEKASPLVGSVAVSLHSSELGALAQIKFPIFNGRYGLNVGDSGRDGSLADHLVEAAKGAALAAWKGRKAVEVVL